MTENAPLLPNDFVRSGVTSDSERQAPILRSTSPVKWAAELAGVREVSLLGTADLRFWSDWLWKEDLLAAECEGRAQLMLIAAGAKYMGLQFTELSISVLVQGPDADKRQNAAYLVGAFNSSALFAFCERILFSTPYEHGAVSVCVPPSTSIELFQRGQNFLKAEMGRGQASDERPPLRSGEDGWEGPVFLPRRRGKTTQMGKLFFARLRGFTQVYPFVPSLDLFVIGASPDNAVLQALCDSNFDAHQWVIRKDAEHAKSKTYNRGMWPLESGGDS